MSPNTHYVQTFAFDKILHHHSAYCLFWHSKSLLIHLSVCIVSYLHHPILGLQGHILWDQDNDTGLYRHGAEDCTMWRKLSTNHEQRKACSLHLLSSDFRRRRRVRSCARRWLQLVGCTALLMDASNFGGPDGVRESGVKPRRSLRKVRAS